MENFKSRAPDVADPFFGLCRGFEFPMALCCGVAIGLRVNDFLCNLR